MTPPPPYRSVALDVDSTLCGIEGIDWLAARRDTEIAERVALETAMAMRGELPLEAVYARRLALVGPSRDEVRLLGEAYSSSLAPQAESIIAGWIRSGMLVALVTGGIRQAILPLALTLGISASHVAAVDLEFDAAGGYAGFDETSPLTTAVGKRVVLESMNLPRPILTVGDGSTDVATREVADAFAAFTGFVARGPVKRRADVVVSSFAELDDVVRNGL